MNMRPYQNSGIKDIFAAWEISDVVFYVMATGLGKTAVSMDITKHFLRINLRVMFIAHTEKLITQAAETYYKNKILAGVIMGDITTHYERNTQVGSIQTLARRKHLPPVDLFIIDEGHHTKDDNSYGNLLKRYPNAKVLIVSATPYRLSGEGFLNVVPGKKTQLVIGPDYADGVADGWLCPIDYYLCSVPDMSNARTSKGDWVEEDAQKAMEMAPIVESYKEHVPGKQGIFFGVNIKHCLDVTAQYWREGIPAEHVNADTPHEDKKKDGRVIQKGRKSIISDYENGFTKVITNVNIYNEGADFPFCHFVQLGKPSKSLKELMQGVGRGSRPDGVNLENIPTSEERKAAIANSTKPYNKVLDNAGCWLIHGMPDDKRNWPHYFNGWKDDKKKPLETMEIMLYEVEDKQGNRMKTHKVEEIVGLKLVRVTKELRRKIINIKAIAEFDRLYKLFCFVKIDISQPAALSIRKYIDYCNTNNILMVPDIWEYMQRKAVLEPMARLKKLEQNRKEYPQVYTEAMFIKAKEKLMRESVTDEYLSRRWREYYVDNKEQLDERIYQQS